MPTQESSPIVGLDIGTTSVRAVVAEALDGQLEIVGVGEAESKGLRKGVISKPELAVEAIKRAIDQAERMSGLMVQSVYVGLSGAHIKGENSQGMIAIPGRHREITDEDVKRVQETACAISIPSGREMADVLPQEYTVDDQDGIDDPRGMLGSRLSVSVHIVTSPVATRQNIINSVNRAGFKVADIYLTQLAAAEAVLTDEDREYGAALVNIGGETTGLAIYLRGAVWQTAVFPVGGSHFTNDIAFGLRTPVPEAERIKREFGCAQRTLMAQTLADSLDGSALETIDVPSVGDRSPRSVSRTLLSEILEPRAEEVFSHVHEEIRRTGYERQLSSGIVLAGGGALLPGMAEVAEQVFDAPVRVGVPSNFGPGNEAANPGFATAVGLAMYGLRCEQGQGATHRHQQQRKSESGDMKMRLKEWLGIKRRTA
jgi:cell division protein FtsA